MKVLVVEQITINIEHVIEAEGFHKAEEYAGAHYDEYKTDLKKCTDEDIIERGYISIRIIKE